MVLSNLQGGVRPWGPLLAAALLLAALGATAQPLPVDERGKVGFYEVVKADSLRAGHLYAHAKSWLRRRGYTLAVADSAAGRLVAANAFGVYDRSYLTKRLHGKVQYQLTVEVKDGRYRLQFQDFSFAYYQEDRTYHWVPTGKTKPLEDATAPGWQKLWESHRNDTRLAVASLSAELKTTMLAVAKAPAPGPRPAAADW
jgi:hypothetical protein